LAEVPAARRGATPDACRNREHLVDCPIGDSGRGDCTAVASTGRSVVATGNPHRDGQRSRIVCCGVVFGLRYAGGDSSHCAMASRKTINSMTSNRFELLGVSKRYGQHTALSDVSLSLEAGTNAAIIGPSGCGKSTLLRLLAGLEAPTAGKILLDGGVASEPDRIVIPPHRRGIAMVFQDLALWPNLSALDNVLLGLSGANLSRRERQQRSREALNLCEVESFAARKPGQLSGGQQQRIALARAIAVQPTFLFLDEPFSGIDSDTKLAVISAIGALADCLQITVILVSHDPCDSALLCRRKIKLSEGRIADQSDGVSGSESGNARR